MHDVQPAAVLSQCAGPAAQLEAWLTPCILGRQEDNKNFNSLALDQQYLNSEEETNELLSGDTSILNDLLANMNGVYLSR